MAADILEHRGAWTWDDLQSIEGHARRLEIQDGSLVVSPSPSVAHQLAAAQLVHALVPRVGPDHAVLPEMDLVLAETSVRIPDVLVVRRAEVSASAAKRLAATAVEIAIEIVSPSSRTTDRIVKPQEYAEAGIPGFWRIELEPALHLVAYHLSDGTYHELGSWGLGERALIRSPLSLSISMDELALPQ